MLVAYARESSHPPIRVPTNPIAIAAMQQAQWSLGNKYQATAQAYVAPAPIHEKSVPPDPRKEWPEPFETGGASFVLDKATGFYYEKESGFYYDATANLYYSGFVKKYFEHTPEQEPPFTEFFPPPPGMENESQPIVATAVSKPAKKKPVKPITVRLKSNAFSAAPKKQMEKVEQWTSQQKEQKPVCLVRA